MRDGQKAALNLANWHHFMDALKLAGYRSEKMISSGTTVIFSYVLYLIGLRDYGVDRVTIRQTIAEFFFRSEEHTSELQSLMRISYAVFCLKTQKQISHNASTNK